MHKLLIAVVWCCLLVTACSIHLRQRLSIPQHLRNIYIESNANSRYFNAELHRYIADAGLNIITHKQAAHWRLVILEYDISNKLLSIDSSQQIRQYLLTCTTTFSLSNKHNHLIVPRRTVTESIPVTLESNQILAGSNATEQLANAMLDRLAYNIFLVVTTAINQHAAPQLAATSAA